MEILACLERLRCAKPEEFRLERGEGVEVLAANEDWAAERLRTQIVGDFGCQGGLPYAAGTDESDVLRSALSVALREEGEGPLEVVFAPDKLEVVWEAFEL